MKFRSLINESKEEWVLFNITDPENMVIFGNTIAGKFKPFKSEKEARKRIPRDEDEHDPDWKVTTKKEYNKLIK